MLEKSKRSSGDVSTNSKGQLNEKSVEGEDVNNTASNDRLALLALEKKEWGKMKDMIFDCESDVLAYLHFHC